MKIRAIIIEDEASASQHLTKLLKSLPYELELLAVLTSVSATLTWWKQNELPDLVIMDIRLSDGTTFELLERIDIPCPIIFTTAYDEYALQAFQTSGIAYLLKPITKDELGHALEKYRQFYRPEAPEWLWQNLETLARVKAVKGNTFKERLLLKKGSQFVPVQVAEVAYFFRDELVFARLFDTSTYLVDEPLDQLQRQLDPRQFLRLNRQVLVNQSAIESFKAYKPGRLAVKLRPVFEQAIHLSQERSKFLRRFFR